MLLHRSTRRGSALVMVLVMVTAMTFAAFAVLSLSDTMRASTVGLAKSDKASLVADAGLAYICEQWRRGRNAGTPVDILAYTDGDADGRATSAAEQTGTPPIVIGTAYASAQGTWTLLSIEDIALSGTTGKQVRVLSQVDGFRAQFDALLAPNFDSPIQGVGTEGDQDWTGGALFDVTGGTATGTVFGNGDFTVGGTSNINGDASFAGTITDPGANSVTGSKNAGVAPYTFPDPQPFIDAAVTDAKSATPKGGAWLDPLNPANFAISGGAPVAWESLTASTSRMGSGWNTTNTPHLKHMFIRGNATTRTVVTYNAGNLAFGRLWIDNATVIIKTPAGGGTFTIPDLYLVNGGRLIIDASNGEASVVTGVNNAYETASNVGTSNPKRWDGSAFSTVAINTFAKQGGSSATNVWNQSGGSTSSSYPKQLEGTGSGYDDWVIEDDSVLAIVTPDINSKGMTMYMQGAADLVLNNGGLILPGVQATDLDTVKTGAHTAVEAIPGQAIGFIAWSGGGNLPRFDLNEGGGGHDSTVYGLIYGGFEGNMEPQGKLIGAFVGQSMDTKGEIYYDARLANLLSSQRANSEHVVYKRRVGL